MGGLFGLPSKGMAFSIWAPGKYNGLSVVDWEQPCQGSTGGADGQKWTWAANAHLEPRKPMIFWAVSQQCD